MRTSASTGGRKARRKPQANEAAGTDMAVAELEAAEAAPVAEPQAEDASDAFVWESEGEEMSFVIDDMPVFSVEVPAGPQPVPNRSHIYNIWNLLAQPRDDCEAEIRALCQTAYLGDYNALCRVLGRYKMYVDTRDIGISSHLMMDGFWEMWVTQAMMRAVRRGSTVIDVGANLGYFTMLLSDLTGPEGRVLSFEPNPNLAPRLRKSIDINGYASFCTLYDHALGDRAGSARMEVMEHQPGGGRTVASGRSSQAGTIPVKRLDSIPGALDAEFIKIDVEGFEQHVWRGMTGILKQDKPLTVFMEFTVSRYADPVGFLKEIGRYGFSLELVAFDGFPRPITVEELMAGSHHQDHMLALRRA